MLDSIAQLLMGMAWSEGQPNEGQTILLREMLSALGLNEADYRHYGEGKKRGRQTIRTSKVVSGR